MIIYKWSTNQTVNIIFASSFLEWTKLPRNIEPAQLEVGTYGGPSRDVNPITKTDSLISYMIFIQNKYRKSSFLIDIYTYTYKIVSAIALLASWTFMHSYMDIYHLYQSGSFIRYGVILKISRRKLFYLFIIFFRLIILF